MRSGNYDDMDSRTEREAKDRHPDTWVEAYPRGVTDEGSIGGDTQAGPAWSRRFVRWMPDVELWAVVNDAFYARYCCDCDVDDGTVCGVENQTETIICADFRDPGDTEIHADYEYNHIDLADPSDDASRGLAEQVTAAAFGDPRRWRGAHRWLPAPNEDWVALPDQGLEVRTTREGSFWRHDPPGYCDTDEGVGPYASPDDAARDGADYARFVAGN